MITNKTQSQLIETEDAYIQISTIKTKAEIIIAGFAIQLTAQEFRSLREAFQGYGDKTIIFHAENGRLWGGDRLLFSRTEEVVCVAILAESENKSFLIHDIEFTRQEADDLAGYGGPLADIETQLWKAEREAGEETEEEIAI